MGKDCGVRGRHLYRVGVRMSVCCHLSALVKVKLLCSVALAQGYCTTLCNWALIGLSGGGNVGDWLLLTERPGWVERAGERHSVMFCSVGRVILP